MQQALDRQLETKDDRGESFRADAEFHRLLVELPGNETLQVLNSMVTDVIRRREAEAAEEHWRRRGRPAPAGEQCHAAVLDG